MSLSTVLVRRDAEKLNFFNFAASLNKRVADDVEKKRLPYMVHRNWAARKTQQV